MTKLSWPVHAGSDRSGHDGTVTILGADGMRTAKGRRRLRFRKRPLGMVSAAVVALLLLGAYPGWLLWTDNFHVVVPGEFYRSGQMDREELSRILQRYQIRAVVNLRGPNGGEPWYDQETRLCRERDVQHVDFRLSARRELASDQVRQLEVLLRALPRPLLVHCDGGGDRSGFAAALYQLHRHGCAPAEARRQLSWRYGHLPVLWWSDSSAMDRTFARVVQEEAGGSSATAPVASLSRVPSTGD